MLVPLPTSLVEDQRWRGGLPNFRDFGPVDDEALREDETRKEEAPPLESRRPLETTLRRVFGPGRGPWRGGGRPARRECLRRLCTPS